MSASTSRPTGFSKGDYPETTREAVDSALAKTSTPDFLDARTIIRASGAIAAGAGIMYATGRCPRLAAATLLVTTSVGWAGRKRIWELSGEERMQELQAILTDAGLLGGVLLAVVDHDGRPSLGHQANKFIERSKKNAAAKQRELEKKADKLGKQAKKRVDATQKKMASARS